MRLLYPRAEECVSSLEMDVGFDAGVGRADYGCNCSLLVLSCEAYGRPVRSHPRIQTRIYCPKRLMRMRRSQGHIGIVVLYIEKGAIVSNVFPLAEQYWKNGY